MRAVTAGETTLLGSAGKRLAYKVEIQDEVNAWQDFTALGGRDWVLGISGNESIDDPIPTLNVELRRDHAGVSLSPFRGDSSLNAGGAAVDVGRGIRVSVAYATYGTAPAAGDYRMVFVGTIDSLDFSQPTISVQARNAAGAKLVDNWVRDETTYGTPAGRNLDLVIQDIITAWAPGITLTVPVAPAYLVTEYSQQPESVWDAIRTLAGLIGWDIRIMWNTTASEFRPALIEPARTKTIPDYTFGPAFIHTVDQLAIDRTFVRNSIRVTYLDAAGAEQSTSATDAPSVTRFGEQWAEIIRGEGSPIDTLAEANALRDAALADLAWPIADQVVQVPYFWPLELGDLYRFSANGIHYDTAQDLASTAHRWRIAPKSARSFISVRGKPAGFYLNWLREGELGTGDVVVPVMRFTTLTHTGSSGTATITVDDPSLIVTALEFKTKIGTAAYGSYLTTWDSATGTAGTAAILVRTESLFVGAKHGSYIKVRVTYLANRASYQDEIEYYFDPDHIAQVLGFSVDFTTGNLVKVTDITSDDDTTNVYVTVTVDGTTPADPTAATNNGSLAGTPPTGAITTALTCPPGSIAKVKIRGANSAGTLGPVRSGERLNQAGATSAVVESVTISGGAAGTGPTDPGTLTLKYTVSAYSGALVYAYLYADGLLVNTWLNGTSMFSDTTGTAYSRVAYRDTTNGVQVNYSCLMQVKDGSTVKASMWSNTYPEYQDIQI